MTKNEFIEKLRKEMKKNDDISDIEDIIEEYEQHFAFKIADGYSESEIIAKLESPTEIAEQFRNGLKQENNTGRKLITIIGLVFTNIFAFIIYLLLWIWEIVMFVAGLCFAMLAICLIFKLNYNSIIPYIPYWCGVSFALSSVAISFLSIIGCIWFYIYIRQLTRVYIRFNHNSMASADGKPVLPSISIYPQISLKKKRILRKCAIISLTAFAVCFVVTMITSMLSAKAFEFWHIWGWFNYININ